MTVAGSHNANWILRVSRGVGEHEHTVKGSGGGPGRFSVEDIRKGSEGSDFEGDRIIMMRLMTLDHIMIFLQSINAPFSSPNSGPANVQFFLCKVLLYIHSVYHRPVYQACPMMQ